MSSDARDRHRRLNEIVHRASRFSGAERDELLRRECGDDEALRREAIAILDSSADSAAIGTGDLGAMLAGSLDPMLASALDETQGGAKPRGAFAIPQRVGAYVLGRELGRGGMGMVFEATDSRTGEQVAVKILHPGLVQGDGAVERFAREARVGASITHGGVVRTLDAGTDRSSGHDLHYLVMERVEGRTLRALLKDLGRVPEGLAREIARQAAAALTAIHAAGVVHRDLKPENVLITDDQRVRVMDLGVAKSAALSQSLTREGQFLGSVSHAAPEQLEGKPVTGATDLYALGVTLHELCSGANPFLREGVGATMLAHLEAAPPPLPGVSPFFAEIVAVLLEKSPERRLPSAEHLQRALAEGESGAWWRERLARREAGPARIAVARAAPMVGREAPLQRLADAWREAQDAGGSAILVLGEPGIGKTRLLAELADLVVREGGLVLHSPLARFDEEGPFASAIAEALGSRASSDVREKLERWPALAGALSGLVGGEASSAEIAPDLLGVALARWVQAASQERPIAWLLDDAQAAPPEALSALRALVGAASSHRVLVVIAGRAEGDASWQDALGATTTPLQLERLPRRDVEALVEHALGSPEAALRLGSRLALRSDGVPGFALDLLRTLQERGTLRRDVTGAWRLGDAADDVDLPAAARDAALARLATLTRDQRDVLDAASVQGLLFDAELVAEQLERPLVRVLQDLAELERRHELVRSEGRLHALDGRVLLEVLQDDLPEMLRRAHHSAIARALQRRVQPGRAIDGRQSEEIARHHLRGRNPEDAVPFLRKALEHAGKLNRHRELVEMADVALRIGDALPPADRAVVLLRLAHSLGILGRREEERSASEVALHLAEGIGDPVILADACMARGLQQFWLARTEDSIPWFERAAAIAREAGEIGAELRATRNLATALGRTGRIDEAVEMHLRTRERAKEIGDSLTQAMASVNLAATRVTHGRLDDALVEYRRGAELAREAGDVRIEAHAEGGLGITCMHLGRRDEAFVHALKQAELSREIGDRRSESLGLGTAGLAAADRGRYAEALSLQSRAAELQESMADPRGRSISAGNLASIRAALGDLEGARPIMLAALELSRASSQPTIEAAHLTRLVQLEESEENWGAMLGWAREAEPIYVRLGDDDGLAQCLAFQGVALANMGRADEAAALLDRSMAMGHDFESPLHPTLASLHRARLPGGDVRAALATLRDQEARLGIPDRIVARHAAWKATGDVAHLARAAELLETLQANAPAAWRDALVERIAVRREIARAWRERRKKGL